MTHTYWLRLSSVIVLVGILGSCGGPDRSLTLVASLAVGSPVYHIAWSADSTLLVVEGDETIQVWDATAHQIVTTYRGHQEDDIYFDLSPDGTFVASVDEHGWVGDDGCVWSRHGFASENVTRVGVSYTGDRTLGVVCDHAV